MAIPKATLETLECAADKLLITVDEPVLKVKKTLHNLQFHNKLKVGTEHVTAELVFYELADKGGAAIPGFCDGMGTSTTFPLAKSGITTCVPKFPGNYEYTVTADDHDKLDPVIIIETIGTPRLPGPSWFDGPANTFDPIQIGVALIVGLVIGGLLGRKTS